MTPDQLAEWRTDMSLTQRAAADALGVSLATYQAMERGATWAMALRMPR